MAIVYTDAAHEAPQTAKLDPGSVTPAGRQLLDGMVNSLRVYGNGDWESSKVLYGCSRSCTRLLAALSQRGITDFAAEDLTLDILRETLSDFDDSTKRTLNKLLGRVLRKHHPKGGPLAYALANTAYMVKDSATEPYDNDVADAIEQAARGLFTEAYIAQRQVLFDQVRERDETIRELRAELKAARRERNNALAYARDLHERLRPEFEAIAREKQEKVRYLRPLPDAVEADE